MDRQVKFKPEVSRAVFDKQRSTDRCIEHVPSASLVDEDEISSHCSKFQEVHRVQKRKLHEHHVQRKKCRLLMRQDIIDAFWSVYEEEAWLRVTEMLEESNNETILHDAILTVDKNNIIKLWHEKCMMMFPVVEQYHMVPFHDRWVQSQFKEEQNIQQMIEILFCRS